MAVVIVIDSQQLWQYVAGYAGFPRQRLERLLHFDQLHGRRFHLEWQRNSKGKGKSKGPTLANCGPGWGNLKVFLVPTISLRR